MMKQNEAVYAAYKAGTEQGLTGPELKAFAVAQVKAGLMDGTISHKAGRLDEKDALSYSRQLVQNWFKKDEKIAGVKYTPTFRRGPQVKDEQLKKLKAAHKALVAHNADPKLISDVEAAINKRKAEVEAQKAQSKVLSIDETINILAELGIEVEATEEDNTEAAS